MTQSQTPNAPDATLSSIWNGVIGLSAAEVEQRSLAGQVNMAAARSGRTYKRIIFDNAFAPVSVVLYVISVMLIALGLPGDAFMTAGLVLLNVVVGSVQESRAKRRLDEISLLVQSSTVVIRDGAEAPIAPNQIVLGDSVLVRQGDELQVDGVVVAEQGLSVDESLLTGESDYIRKHKGDRLHAGSYCTAGAGVYEADKVGADSLAQQITARARAFQMVQTPLQREVSIVILAMAVVVAILGLSVINALVRLYGGVPLHETVRAAAVIVALVPQGLAFMITVSYAKAAVRIASMGALVQRLSAIESISHVDVLCIDKTGTLTTNELSLEALEVFNMEQPEVEQRLGQFAASASVRNKTSVAIATAFPASPLPVRLDMPFDSERKWSALAFEDGTLYVLGAPEVLEAYLTDGSNLEQRLAVWLERGLRVLLFTYLPDAGEMEDGKLPSGLQPLALVILRDQMRPESGETIRQFAAAGITVKVLSGDHPDAVASLAAQAGIDSGAGGAVSGAQLDEMDDATLAKTAREAVVFGRITPDHKERLVGALRDSGRTVAMIGDGVNDIPALKRASVSVAMRSGSPATRGVADVVLLNDSFGVLPAAFLEGQRIRAGMETVVRLFLVRTLSLSLVILAASLLTDAFPTTPRQAGIPALLAVGIPSLILVFTARPARTNKYLLPSSLAFLVPTTLTIALACIVVFHGFLRLSDNLEHARTALVIQQVICGLTILPFARRPSQRAGLREPDVGLAVLAVVLFSAGIGCMFVETARHFFELAVLTPFGYVAVGLTTAAWALALHFIWRVLPDMRRTPADAVDMKPGQTAATRS